MQWMPPPQSKIRAGVDQHDLAARVQTAQGRRPVVVAGSSNAHRITAPLHT